MGKTNLTIQSIVKNEPFVYYAIKSVYDYCDEILLYDTGSTDHTKSDIQDLLNEDTERKIKYKEVKLGFDEERWSLTGLQNFIKDNKGKMSVGRCRQLQIDETKTKYFMLVDGDEIHYRSAMENISKELLPNFPGNKYAVGLPLTWMFDLESTFTQYTFPFNGRIFVTDKVEMNDDSPNEQHLVKEDGSFFTYEHPRYLVYDKVEPYMHMETVLRPWRRKFLVKPSSVLPFYQSYPEVMVENPKYLDRFKMEHGKCAK